MEQKLIKSMTGYKATDKNMQCRGFQFKLGEWFEMPKDRPLVLCEYGFHFCKYMSGIWAYRSEDGTRVFKVEAEEILDTPIEPGADYKLVAYRVRLIEEVKIGGEKNTGDRNTGYGNTGYGNTGDRNTGDRNTGYRNTGDGNTGYGNTGYGNTGNRNTGYGNTGYGNTGDRNTGDGNTGNRNTGDGNTGDRNTGYRNTGDGNIGNFHAGFFNQKSEKVICFDVQTKYTREQFEAKYNNLLNDLLCALGQEAEISYSKFKKIPGITKKKLASLHKAHLDARKSKD